MLSYENSKHWFEIGRDGDGCSECGLPRRHPVHAITSGNHRHGVTTEIGTFQVEQRNVGYADNDGRWVVRQNPELFWWPETGTLYQRRPGKLIGVFDTLQEAAVAINTATVQPIVQKALA